MRTLWATWVLLLVPLHAEAAPSTPEQCRTSDVCEIWGWCTPDAEGTCRPGSDADCVRTPACSDYGQCHFDPQAGHGQPFGPSAGQPFGPSAGGLDFFLTHEDAGPLLRADLEKAANFLRNVDATRPPKLVFGREASALVLETLQRTLFLRLGDAQLPPLGKFVLQLAGAIVCAYVYHRSDTFGRALAAWSRLSRLPDFWVPFIPDADAARALMTGVPA